jgi:hypothetical protein
MIFHAGVLTMTLCAQPSRAQDVGDYLNLSYTGDGETPSGLERLAPAAQRTAPPLAGSVAVEGSAGVHRAGRGYHTVSQGR